MATPMCKQHESGGEVMACDRISDLPDELLHHILSFLPMKEAVATCLLSKRWKPLWLSLTSLDFDDLRFDRRDKFLQFVDAVLLLGDYSKTIKKFCLSWCGYRRLMPPIKIDIWINSVINQKVEHLELHTTFSQFVHMPSRIFNCSTIRILKLSGFVVNTPSSFNLPSLKVLDLRRVQFPDSKCLVNLISSCPLLEDLTLGLLETPDHYNSTLDIEVLEKLVSAEILPIPIKLKAFSNVSILRISSLNYPARPDIPTFYNLVCLEFRSYSHGWNMLMKCLQNSPKLQILAIDQFYCQGQLVERMLDVPECLSSHLRKFFFRDYLGLENQFELVRFIMKNARVVKTISIFSFYKPEDRIFNRLCSCPKSSVNGRILINNNWYL